MTDGFTQISVLAIDLIFLQSSLVAQWYVVQESDTTMLQNEPAAG